MKEDPATKEKERKGLAAIEKCMNMTQ